MTKNENIREDSALTNFNRFLDELKQEVSDLAGDEYTVNIMPVTKNNGVRMTGMTIIRPGDQVSPNLYLNGWYDCYKSGMSVRQVAEHLMELYRESVPKGSFDANELFSPDMVRGNLVYRIVNRERNRKLLTEIPHRDFLDLSLVYYVLVHSRQLGEGAVLMRDESMRAWGLAREELDEVARANTKRLLPSDFLSITAMLKDLEKKSDTVTYPDMEIEEQSMDTPMYVLTNSERQYGACYLADREVVAQIAEEMSDDLFLLPSSIHECMVLPCGFGGDPEKLADLVREINRTQVAAEDYLGDSVYYYCRETGDLEIAA